jgi:hypothetical protein
MEKLTGLTPSAQDVYLGRSQLGELCCALRANSADFCSSRKAFSQKAASLN